MKTSTVLKTRLKSCLKNGVFITAIPNTDFEFESIFNAGWIFITSIGNENLYFIFKDDMGNPHSGYCKCL